MHTTLTQSLVSIRRLALLGACLCLGACGVGPKLGPFEAHAPPDGTNQFSAVMLPTMAVTATRQLTDRLDGGIAQEGLVTNGWLNYRVFDNPEGLAVAGTLGAFRGDPNFKAKGGYAGAITSYRRDRWTLSLAVRTHAMSYEPGDIGDFENGHLAFPEITTDSLERYNSIELSLSLRLKTGAYIRAGLRCGDDQPGDRDLDSDVRDVETGCLPIIALSF